MKKTRWLTLIGFLVVVTACGKMGGSGGALSGSRETAGLVSPEVSDASATLAGMVDDWFEDYLALNPVLATYIGDHRFDNRYQNWIGTDYREASAALSRDYLALARSVDRAALGADDRVTLDIFIGRLEEQLRSLAFPSHLLPFDQLNSDPNFFAMIGSGNSVHPFTTVRDYDNFLSRIDDFVIWMETAVLNMRQGMAVGVVQPRLIVERMIPQIRAQVVDSVEESLFFRPVRDFPDDFTAAERERLEAAYRAAISSILVPAYRDMAEFLEQEYLPAARPTVGYDDLPGGNGWYDYLVAHHTTTDLTAEEIHRLGLGEVARILKQMEEVMRRVGFDGDLRDFFVYLKTDPDFFWDDPEAILAEYRALRARVEAGLPGLFGVSPRAGFEIRAVEPFRAESAAGASYEAPSADGSRPGVFYLNVWDLTRLARWGKETLFLHEAIPGHHFQGAIAQENEHLPRFRRFMSVTAYTEGWALYSEDLGPELGMFEDPYQWFGKLNDEMLRAMRLVVDTGIHRFDWSREQAIEYMLDNSSLAESDIVAEVERYIVDPGQALAYKVGQLELRRLRAEAEDTLGDDFDLRGWHDHILDTGEVPLDVLSASSRAWVEDRR
jgi:uncharacterized protein (DUF885 family)